MVRLIRAAQLLWAMRFWAARSGRTKKSPAIRRKSRGPRANVATADNDDKAEDPWVFRVEARQIVAVALRTLVLVYDASRGTTEGVKKENAPKKTPELGFEPRSIITCICD